MPRKAGLGVKTVINSGMTHLWKSFNLCIVMSNFTNGSIVQWKGPHFVSSSDGNGLSSHDMAWIDDRRTVLYNSLFD